MRYKYIRKTSLLMSSLPMTSYDYSFVAKVDINRVRQAILNLVRVPAGIHEEIGY